MAGGDIKPGIVYGETDDFSYNIVENPVHIHDLNATILKCLGIDHKRLSYKFQGLDIRLTGVEEQHPVETFCFKISVCRALSYQCVHIRVCSITKTCVCLS